MKQRGEGGGGTRHSRTLLSRGAEDSAHECRLAPRPGLLIFRRIFLGIPSWLLAAAAAATAASGLPVSMRRRSRPLRGRELRVRGYLCIYLGSSPAAQACQDLRRPRLPWPPC